MSMSINIVRCPRCDEGRFAAWGETGTVAHLFSHALIHLTVDPK